eukprot:m.38404 g.38404  ORF g.38404 m.38404 type:complete len:236 (-) comp9432_c0_seq1:15-722(-)
MASQSSSCFLCNGKVYKHKKRETPTLEGPSELRSICVYPTKENLTPVLGLLQKLGIKQVVSVGSGECFLEGLMEQECPDLNITCVDLDIFPAFPHLYNTFHTYNNSGEIIRLPTGGVLDLKKYFQSGDGEDDPEDIFRLDAEVQRDVDWLSVALLFCFGKRIPFQSYIDQVSEISTIIIIGDVRDEHCSTCITSPAAYSLASNRDWTIVLDVPCRATLEDTRLIVYRRKAVSNVQ